MDLAHAQRTLEAFVRFLAERQERIAEEWMNSIHRGGRFQTAERLTTEMLRRHLPDLFQDLANVIRSPLAPAVQSHADESARAHGQTRFLQHYRLNELVREIAALRNTIVGHVVEFEEQTPGFAGPPRRVALQRLHGFFDDLIADAVEQFTQAQQSQLQQHLTTARARVDQERGQRREAQTDLQSAASEAAQLREIDAARLTLLRTVAHELRNSVQSAQMTIHELQEEPHAGERAALLSGLARTIDHLGALLKDLLEYALLLDSARGLRLEPVSLPELCEDLSAIYAPLAEAKGLAFAAECEPALVVVISHHTKLVQIAANLLSNAIKYTTSGRVRLWIAGVDAGHWSLMVEDTGPGIAPEEREKIFTEFHRVRKTAHVEGTGLGLAVVKRVAKLLGGDVQVEAATPQGSRFVAILPRELTPEAARALCQAGAGEAGAARPGTPRS